MNELQKDKQKIEKQSLKLNENDFSPFIFDFVSKKAAYDSFLLNKKVFENIL
jgi:hypothetical protein